MKSWTIIEDRCHAQKTPPLHPGEVLREEFLVPLGLSPGALAKAMGVPRTRVERIAAKSTGITADTALRLSKALGTSAQVWLNLQNRYDVQTAERAIGKQLAKIARVTAMPRPDPANSAVVPAQAGTHTPRTLDRTRRMGPGPPPIKSGVARDDSRKDSLAS